MSVIKEQCEYALSTYIGNNVSDSFELDSILGTNEDRECAVKKIEEIIKSIPVPDKDKIYEGINKHLRDYFNSDYQESFREICKMCYEDNSELFSEIPLETFMEYVYTKNPEDYGYMFNVTVNQFLNEIGDRYLDKIEECYKIKLKAIYEC